MTTCRLHVVDLTLCVVPCDGHQCRHPKKCNACICTRYKATVPQSLYQYCTIDTITQTSTGQMSDDRYSVFLYPCSNPPWPWSGRFQFSALLLLNLFQKICQKILQTKDIRA